MSANLTSYYVHALVLNNKVNMPCPVEENFNISSLSNKTLQTRYLCHNNRNYYRKQVKYLNKKLTTSKDEPRKALCQPEHDESTKGGGR